MILVVLSVVAAVTVFMVFLWWRIFSKAGYSGALGLLMFVPFGCLIIVVCTGIFTMAYFEKFRL